MRKKIKQERERESGKKTFTNLLQRKEGGNDNHQNGFMFSKIILKCEKKQR